MLELKGIKKDYLAGENTVHALKGIDILFRKSEFVSILGPSGCGKTTMLNIIGGLDQYTEGDLIINGKSTKSFKDRDWDAYRNYSIGFVFQSYNLIPHQTVLQNVELALTLSGVSKSERRERAKKALEEVGLGNQLHKKPSEMSGGQMQRVAIARALVNNPDIILADEPTGALDTETSVQVMEILKKIASDRLIVMVTHNPDLAEKYSSRIIRMLDGEVKSDSMPLTPEEIKKEREADQVVLEAEKASKKKQKKPSMSLMTSFGLSLKNLFTKKGRTTLTSFAGSIGIIGIALILSISQGLTAYIDMVQEDTLSSYPLTIESSTIDISTLMETFMNVHNDEVDHDKDAVYKKQAITDMVNALANLEVRENDLKTFKEDIEEKLKDEDSEFSQAINGIQYGYSINPIVYTKNVDGNIIKSDTTELLTNMISEYMGMDFSAMTGAMGTATSGNSTQSSLMSMSPMAAMSSSTMWQELLTGKDGAPINELLERQYDVIYGSWPNSYDEVVLVVDENNELDDLTLYAIGLLTDEHIDNIMDAAMNGKELSDDNQSWSYEDVCGRTFRIVLNPDCYVYDEVTNTYTDLRDTDTGVQYLYDNGIEMKVVGIIRQNEDAQAAMLTGSIGYTSMLTEYIVEHNKDSAVINAQLENPTIDIFTNLPFKDTEGTVTDEKKAADFREYISSLRAVEKAAAYVKIKSVPAEDYLNTTAEQMLSQMTVEDMKSTLTQALSTQMGMSEENISAYLDGMGDDELIAMFTTMVKEQIKAQYAEQVMAQMSAMDPAQLVAAMDAELGTYSDAECAAYYDAIMEFSDSTYDANMQKLGYVDLDDPSTINFYASSFANKDVITDYIAEYNKDVDDIHEIKYTDYIGLMMSSITTIINAITYVLIGFVAISLIVSSIMIGVITLISVQERTKEIGILRAIGASKHNVSSMFNAETIIIGFCSGLLGIIVTMLLCIPINAVIHSLTGITALNAYLPPVAAVILVAISVLLTLVSGIIPSKSAAKKDPVVALRSE